MKVFISQKMRGWKPEDILDVRAEVEALVRRNHGDNVEIIDSYIPELADMKPIQAIAKSLALLAEADAVYFVGEPYSGGMAIEHHVCKAYNIPHVIVDREDSVTCACRER